LNQVSRLEGSEAAALVKWLELLSLLPCRRFCDEQVLGKKFQNESAILNKIRHANIVSVLDQGDGEDATGRNFSFIVLEFMSGGDLMTYARTKPKQSLGLAETLFYFKQICDGLSHAHACGVIHRDLKPDNLLLSADSRNDQDCRIACALKCRAAAVLGVRPKDKELIQRGPKNQMPSRSESVPQWPARCCSFEK
jgi:serine/threonine protein kinase